MAHVLKNLDVYNMAPPMRQFVRALQVYSVLGLAGGCRSIRRALEWPRARFGADLSCMVNDYHLYLNPNDEGISRELYLYGIHEPITTTLMQRELHPGMRVIDIGANIGYYTILEARLVSPAGRVFALEPYPPSAALLKKNVRANGFEHIVAVEQAAVGATEGSAQLSVWPMANWNSLTKPAPGMPKIDVRLVPIDQVNSFERVDFVRMDIEGYEVFAVQGMMETLRRSRPTLCMELHPHNVGPEPIVTMLQSLSELSYTVKYAYPRKLDLIGIGEVGQVTALRLEDLIASESALHKRMPYTVWLHVEKPVN